MFVYILANDTNVCIYTGVTNDLARRLYEHKKEIFPDSFTAKHHIHKLVYFEETGSPLAAIEREKQIKSWNRKRKNKLIEANNPEWKDLSQGLELSIGAPSASLRTSDRCHWCGNPSPFLLSIHFFP